MKKQSLIGKPITSPVRAISDWLDASKLTLGPLFCPINRHGQMRNMHLSGQAIALIVKLNYLIENEVDSVSSHSLRTGFVIIAAKKKVSKHLIMKTKSCKRNGSDFFCGVFNGKTIFSLKYR